MPVEIKGGKKEQIIRTWYNEKFGDNYPNKASMTDLHQQIQVDVSEQKISYGMLNGIMKDIKEELGVEEIKIEVKQKHNEDIEPEIVKVSDMDFPEFGLHRCGKFIDTLMSDFEEGGGLYGGTVNIVVGESGVGKSTILLDALAGIRRENPEAKVLYISSEMTKNDIFFYLKKTPIIGDLPTLLLMDYVQNGGLDKVLVKAFNGEYDVILVDSHQDIVVKLKDVLGWKASFAETWMTNMMIEAAEKNGTAILAIQHMTKGGQYVGSTYLKHATTSMLEIRFDSAGKRFIEYSKNRRGGSAVGKRLYFTLEEGEIVYDVDRFEETQNMDKVEEVEKIRQAEAEDKFQELFMTANNEEWVDKKDEEEGNGIGEAPANVVEFDIEEGEN